MTSWIHASLIFLPILGQVIYLICIGIYSTFKCAELYHTCTCVQNTMSCKRMPQVTRYLLSLPLPPNLDRFFRWGVVLSQATLIYIRLIFHQVCRGEFKYCQEAVDNVKSVTSCPTSEKQWESAANRKNCQLTAAQQTCSEPETFVYHCVINGYGNETLEVCAPRRLMIGNVFNF